MYQQRRKENLQGRVTELSYLSDLGFKFLNF